MYYRDHAPPHFHAIYGEYDAEVEVATGRVIAGDLPKRAKTLVSEWAKLHRDDLSLNWNLARAAQPLNSIPPLQ